MTQPNVLFVGTKWCEGNPDYGLSAYEYSLWESFEACGLATYETFHLDEYFVLNQHCGDQALIQKCIEMKPDFIFVILLPVADFFANPSFETLSIIRHTLNIPVFAMWGDLHQPFIVDFCATMQPHIDYNIVTGSSAVLSRVLTPEKYLYFWCPKDPRVFYNPNLERDISVSFLGSSKHRPDRLEKLDYLVSQNINLYRSGGEREERLTLKQYAQVFQRSKITLSFCHSSHSMIVVNARPFEATLCGALLMEQAGFETAKLFKPFEDYVPYTSKTDLADKVHYYLSHEDERSKIAASGCQKSQNLYSAYRFWELILKNAEDLKVSKKSSYDARPLDLSFKRLHRAGLWTILKFKLQNIIYTNPTLFNLLFQFNQRDILGKFKQQSRSLIQSYTQKLSPKG